MYPCAQCKTSDKSIEKFERMKKIKLVVMFLLRIKGAVFMHRLNLEIKKISISHLNHLTNNHLRLEIIRLLRCHYFILFISIS